MSRSHIGLIEVPFMEDVELRLIIEQEVNGMEIYLLDEVIVVLQHIFLHVYKKTVLFSFCFLTNSMVLDVKW